MLSEDEILSTLDSSNKLSAYSHWIQLGHPYSYLIDCRLNIFRSENDQWAIVAERLGYNPRGGRIELEIDYFGNCLVNLEEYNKQVTNYYIIYSIIEDDNFEETTDGEWLKPNSKYWLVRGSKVPLNHKKQNYLDKGIELKEYEPCQISIEEAARLVVIDHRNLFRANDDELYKSIPRDLKKISVLDEWYHKDFSEIYAPMMSGEDLKYIYEFNKENGGLGEIDFVAFETICRNQEKNNEESNREQWEENRPGVYETWQQLAKVIVTGNTSFYKPTISPNTHWINWPDSGSL